MSRETEGVDTMVAGTVLAQGLGVLRVGYLAWALAPVELGGWRVAQLIIGFAGYSHLGIFSALARELAIARGKEAGDKVEHVARVARFASGRLALAGAVVAAGAAWALLEDRWLPWVPLATGVAVVVQQGLEVRRAEAVARSVYSKGALLPAAAAAGTLLLLPLAVWLWGVPGAVIAAPLGQIAAIIIVPMPVRRDPEVGWREALGLIRVGFPITLNNFVRFLSTSLDSVVVGVFFGYRAIGLYAVGATVASALQLFATSTGQVVTTHLALLRGRYGAQNIALLWPRIVGGTRTVLSQLAMALAAVIVLFPIVVWRFLPAYRPAVWPTIALVAGAFFGAFRYVTGSALNVLDRQWQFLAVQVVSIALATLLATLSALAGGDLLEVALAFAAANAALALTLCLIAAYATTGRVGHGWSLYALSLVTLAIAIVPAVPTGVLIKNCSSIACLVASGSVAAAVMVGIWFLLGKVATRGQREPRAMGVPTLSPKTEDLL